MRSMRSGIGTAAVAVLLVGVAACGSGGSKVSTESTSPPATGTTVAVASTTSPASTLPAPDGVTVAAPLVSEMGWAMRLFAFGDEYLRMSATDGVVDLQRSSDGVSWRPATNDLAVHAVRFIAANTDELFVSAGWGSSTTSPMSISVSEDGASSWSSAELPVPLPSSKYVMVDTNLSALAATDTAAVALGTIVLRGDWSAYSREVLGVDHGQVTSEGGASNAWTVEFEDGFDMTVDVGEVGMPELAANGGVGVTGWVRSGAQWELTSLPFTSNTPSSVPLVSGPAGFLTVGAPASALFGPMEYALYHSTDGRNWESTPLPEIFSDEERSMGLFAAGGPLGYVLIGETRLAFSADGVTWTEAATYDDLAADAAGFLSAFPPAAGAAGFAVAFADPTGSSDGRVLTSLDGVTWDAVPLPEGAYDAMVAVGDDSIVVWPVIRPPDPESEIPIDSSVIERADGVGGWGGQRPTAMCAAPETVMLVAYDLESGEYRWHRCGTSQYWMKAITDTAVYVSDIGVGGPKVLEIDTATGAEQGSIEETRIPSDAAYAMDEAPELDGLQITGGQDDPLIVTDSATGAQLWSVRDHLTYDDVWAVGDDAVYMAHLPAEGEEPVWKLRAYELRPGEIRWEMTPSGESYPWWVGGGRVFSVWTDLTVLDTRTGDVLWATDYGTRTFPGMRGVLANDDTVVVAFASQFGGGD